MAWVIYNNFKKMQMDGADTHAKAPVDLNTNTIRLMLLDAGSTIDQTDVDVTDILAGGSDSEVTGTNYARKSIASVTVTSSGGTVTVDANDPAAYAQHASGFNDAKYAVLYKFSTGDASSPLVASYTFTSNQNNVSGSLTLQFSAAGIFTLA